jgi:hypothetical protein
VNSIINREEYSPGKGGKRWKEARRVSTVHKEDIEIERKEEKRRRRGCY